MDFQSENGFGFLATVHVDIIPVCTPNSYRKAAHSVQTYKFALFIAFLLWCLDILNRLHIKVHVGRNILHFTACQ